MYRNSDMIIAVGEGYKRDIIKNYGVEEKKIQIVTNGVDLDFFRFNEIARHRVRQSQRWEKKFVVLYLGTHGVSHGLDSVVQAARICRNSHVQFVFVGEGGGEGKAC